MTTDTDRLQTREEMLMGLKATDTDSSRREAEWLQHDGRDCPVQPQMMVEIETRSGIRSVMRAALKASPTTEPNPEGMQVAERVREAAREGGERYRRTLAELRLDGPASNARSCGVQGVRREGR